ncbi:MAG: hypothetical protein KF780_06370 [Sphingomonas sp.]|nr:hypothetical protein [Sphingomonas sp.]
MTFSIDGTDIGQAIELAIVVGTIVMMAIGAFVVWLMVRPPRHVREERRQRGRKPEAREIDAATAEEMVRLIERMEDRLAVLERAVGDVNETPRRIEPRGQELFEAGEKSPETRRVK